MKDKSGTEKPYTGPERRRVRRRVILDTFSLFITVPKKGDHRLRVRDLSEAGMGFDLDMQGESFSGFPVTPGQAINLNLYLNQSLYIPLSVDIVRVIEHDSVRKVGAEMTQRNSKGYDAFLAFLRMLDEIKDVAEIEAKNSY